MSSVQGSSSTISSGAVERVRKLLDELDGRPALNNLPAAMRLREQLEKNVKTTDSAAALVGQLSGTQRDVLREALPSLPTVKAFFKDAFDRAPGPQDNVMSAQHGLERDVRGSEGSSERVNDARSLNPADVQGRLRKKGEPAAADAPRTRRRRVEEEGASAVGSQTAQPATPGNAANNDPKAATDPKPVTGAARKARADGAAPVGAAANTDAPAAVGETEKVDGATAADGSKTASGAPADVPRDIHQLLDDTLDFIKMHLSPQSTKLYQEAIGIAEKLAQDSQALGQDRARQAELNAIPKEKRKPEEVAQLKELNAKLRGASDPKKLGKDFEKLAKQWGEIPNHAGLLQAYYGLEKNRPSIDEDTPEGRNTLAFFDELVGRDTNLPPDIKEKIAAFRQTDEGKRMLSIKPNMDVLKALSEGKLNTGNPFVKDVLERVSNGQLVSEAEVRAVLGMPPPEGAAQNPGAGDPTVPPANGAPPKKPPHGPDAGGNDHFDPARSPHNSNAAASAAAINDKWFNPLNRNWFGLSRIRHDQLKNDGHHELLHAIQEYNHKTQSMHVTA
ncbi:MAG: hypothetical protein ACAI38_09070, partial [Myxococcota bacterium]